jgi:hypothetical protein
MPLITLFLLISPLAHAADFPVSRLKQLLCPYSAAMAKKTLIHELLEHGGLEEMRAALEEKTHQFGPCREVQALGGTNFELHYRDAIVPLEVISEGQKVRSFYLGMPEMRDDTAAKVITALKKEPYQTAFYAGTESGHELLSYQPDLVLSISRSNQIFLLRATRDAALAPSEALPLEEKSLIRSFGILQFWKIGTLLTVDSLLQLLVSEKDLTASDLLLARLGPSKVAKYGKSLAPFLSFREYFLLSALPREKLKDRNAVSTQLAALGNQLAPAPGPAEHPELLSVLGWFASPRELCESALAVKEELVARNRRLNSEYQAVQPKNVEVFGIVQTRDTGISQLTQVYKLHGQSEWRCLALTANHHDEIEEGFFSSITARLSRLAD